MSEENVYLLDSSVLIQAKRQYYGFDVCPGFWDSLLHFHNEERIKSIDKVKKELEEGNDELAAWAKNTVPSDFFISTNEPGIIEEYGKMMAWVNGQAQFMDAAKEEFAKEKNADGWLIACAKEKNFLVVTHEVLDRDIKKRVPIPNVCEEFQVGYLDLFTMLRALGVKFTWTAV